MEVYPIKMRIMRPPQDDLFEAIKTTNLVLQEGDCVAVTSKVVSIWQGRCVPVDSVAHKDDLSKKEADLYLEREYVPHGHVLHTIKNNYLISSAGIDMSNANGYYVLWPNQPKKVAEELLAWFKDTYSVSELSLIITDSHSVPFRRGAMGCAIGWAGFDPLYDHRGVEDIFGRELRAEHTNVADSLAAAAVLVMGETNECTPLAIIRNAPYLKGRKDAQERVYEYEVPMEQDMYAPFFTHAPWKRGDGGAL
jgi:coenzyme F420-0:L-glutamate ligase